MAICMSDYQTNVAGILGVISYCLFQLFSEILCTEPCHPRILHTTLKYSRRYFLALHYISDFFNPCKNFVSTFMDLYKVIVGVQECKYMHIHKGCMLWVSSNSLLHMHLIYMAKMFLHTTCNQEVYNKKSTSFSAHFLHHSTTYVIG